MDTINDRIFTLRTQAGISQQRLADDLKLSRRAISLWETGRRTPDIQSVLLLAGYFQVSLDYLVKGSRA